MCLSNCEYVCRLIARVVLRDLVGGWMGDVYTYSSSYVLFLSYLPLRFDLACGSPRHSFVLRWSMILFVLFHSTSLFSFLLLAINLLSPCLIFIRTYLCVYPVSLIMSAPPCTSNTVIDLTLPPVWLYYLF